jgi:hypothetical protein
MVFDCSECYGAGLVFIGNDNDYEIEPCQCVKENA